MIVAALCASAPLPSVLDAGLGSGENTPFLGLEREYLGPWSHIDAASTTMEKWQRAWPIGADRGPAKRGRTFMSVVWSGWDLIGREASCSPHAYFERAQNKRSRFVVNNKRGKVLLRT